jgi:hypothetical protein
MKMRKSYIANSAEALNLHNGTQTAIVVVMKVQPTPPKAIYAQDDCKIVISDTAILQVGLYASRVLWNCKKHPHIKDCTVWENNLPYALGQEVHVREAWCMPDDEYFYKANGMQKHEHYLWDGKWNSAATMPKSAARTRFKIVSCEAVRVRDITEEQAKILLDKSGTGKLGSPICWRDYLAIGAKYCHTKDNMRWHWSDSLESYIITRFGNSAWDNNDYIWYYKIEKI